MPVQTRSITRALHQQDLRSVPFKLNVITTAGISSRIAKQLPADDIALKGLFLLTNDSRMRNELLPVCETIIAKWKNTQEQKRAWKEFWYQEKMKAIESVNMRNEIMRTIQAHIITNNCTDDLESYFKNMCDLYEYLCRMLPHGLLFLGKRFARAAQSKLYEFEETLEDDDTTHRLKLYEFEQQLWSYFEWGNAEDY